MTQSDNQLIVELLQVSFRFGIIEGVAYGLSAYFVASCLFYWADRFISRWKIKHFYCPNCQCMDCLAASIVESKEIEDKEGV